MVFAVALASTAIADADADVPRARDRIVVLDGGLSMRVADGVATDGLAIETTTTTTHGATALELAGADRELGCAPIQRLAVAQPLVVYGAAPALPMVTHGRALAFAAYVARLDGAIEVVRFYIIAADVEHARAAARKARAIAATLAIE